MSSDSSQAADLELQFKKRARRRLVGAIALVLVMLVVLPMVLDDHEHNAPQQAVTISIPSQNAEFTTQAPLKAPEPAPVQASPAPAVASPVTETPAVEAPPVVKESVEKKPIELKKPVDVKKPDETKKNDEGKKVEPAKKNDDKKDKSAAESVDKAASDKVAKAKANAADKASTLDKSVADAKSAETKVYDDSGKPYYLQIGVFSDGVNVSQLQKKLGELKLKSYTEKISTDKGDKTRLRVGPFDNKDQADHAAERVKTIGLTGFVSNK